MFKYQEIGEILKPVQSKGELLATIKQDYIDDALKSSVLFLGLDGLDVPFFIETIEHENDLFSIKFEEFSHPQDIKKHNGIKLKLRHTDINWNNKKTSNPISEENLNGFTLLDNTTGIKALIKNIEQFPFQLMATVEVKGKSHLIPIIEEFIDDIDEKNKILKMTLSEGIFEL